MQKFKEFSQGLFRSVLDSPTTVMKLKSSSQILYLKFNSKDIVTGASYSGSIDPWLASLCSLALDKSLNELLLLNEKSWEIHFKDDQSFWDIKGESEEDFFFIPLELLRASLDSYRGRDYLYHDGSPLVCRCFGIRENDVLEFLKKEGDHTLENLSTATKAGMGCRSCVPQLERWLSIKEGQQHSRFYKDKSRADWLLKIDASLSQFPEASDWKMDVVSFKDNIVIISFDKSASQSEEEEVAKKLQGFLAGSVDPDLGFFLRRAEQRSKASG